MEEATLADSPAAAAVEIRGVEELGAAFQGVDLRMAPLETGGLDTGVYAISAGLCFVQRHWADVPLLVEGAVEPDKVGLLFAARNDRGTVYNGHAPPSGGAILYAPGAAHTGSGGSYENLSLIFPADLYWENLSALLGGDAGEWAGPHRILPLEPRAQRRMERLLRAPEAVLRSGAHPTEAGSQLCEESVPAICALLAEALAARRSHAVSPPGDGPSSTTPGTSSTRGMPSPCRWWICVAPLTWAPRRFASCSSTSSAWRRCAT